MTTPSNGGPEIPTIVFITFVDISTPLICEACGGPCTLFDTGRGRYDLARMSRSTLDMLAGQTPRGVDEAARLNLIMASLVTPPSASPFDDLTAQISTGSDAEIRALTVLCMPSAFQMAGGMLGRLSRMLRNRPDGFKSLRQRRANRPL